jgi:hypothetical protein
LYYPFDEAFHEHGSPNLATLLETEGFAKLCDIEIEIGTTKSLDELCMDEFIVTLCYFVLVWIRNFFLDRKNSGLDRILHMNGININILSWSTQYLVISCL